jgi:hypothetical protein
LLCHADRPESDYTVDFSGDAWLEYVPSLRPPAQIIVTQVVTTESLDDEPQSVEVSFERNAHTVQLDAFGAAVLELVDGARPIRHILHETSQIGTLAGWDASEHVESARLFFRRMAEWDHFQFEIR